MNLTDIAEAQVAIEHGLTQEEYDKICEILGRQPNHVEVGIFSAMWSEHCSYKNSILQLKTFPSRGKRSLNEAGEENAGVVDIGDGYACAFKVESHNHPTAVEPYQGAATGVGGIMRDIFTMGARPVTTLNSLRFGNPEQARNEFLLKHAVKGIGDYGNCLGITVSGGELFIDDSFSKNPLVNAMTVGVLESKDLQTSKASTSGQPVLLIGATTGRDGIHGASFASADLTKETEEKRSAVQVGDPFMEKLLLEATLELIDKKLIESIQDMGAAGISCSSSEMSAKGGLGMDLFLEKVPVREDAMNAYEIMLSESQERMLAVAPAANVEAIKEVVHKWDLEAVEIGQTTDSGMLNVYQDGTLYAAIPADSLVLGGGAPRYKREQKEPASFAQNRAWDAEKEISEPSVADALKDAVEFSGSVNIASRRPLFDQYDTTIGNSTLVAPGSDSGLHRVHGTDKALATTLDCNSRYVQLDPYNGAGLAVAESIRNLAVRGAETVGITNCLNFGNPYVPENYWYFAESIRGIGDVCRFFDIPVTGGNVSFYNESDQGPVFPTPTIGNVGLLEDYRKSTTGIINAEGLQLYLVGQFKPVLGGSEFLSWRHKTVSGAVPALDLASEKKYAYFITGEIRAGRLAMARDISIGGLWVALVRALLEADYRADVYRPVDFGLEVDLACVLKETSRIDTLLFGESGASYLVGVEETHAAEFEKEAASIGGQFCPIGKSTLSKDITLSLGKEKGSVDVDQLRKNYHQGLAGYFSLEQLN